ncbi:hypothetical protein [Prosthecomicrobium hirschii]|uniref:hypothetical protein n=1 Tax=Prosthecodimorpha hirschii TaxID=665126 RepID=UPI002220B143|nr:hypothetical protein [Prosthecomicrobium hirschii]MCW1839769.1 hypothetical protein [Prosthecomicrobium hirschii]
MTDRASPAPLSEGWAAHILIDPAYQDGWFIAFAKPFETWIERQGDDFYLRSVFFRNCANAKAVRPMAIDILRVLTGAMSLTLSPHETRVLGVVRVDSNGRRQITFLAEGGYIRISGSSLTEDGEPAARRAVIRASKSEYLEEALAYFGDQGGWFDLYKCIESVEQWAGGEHKLTSMNLIPAIELKRTKHTANNMRHARLKNTAVTNAPSFWEAQDVVRNLLNAALAYQVTVTSP